MPIFYPKPLLTAMNICVAEVWGPPGQTHDAEMGRIQTYVCPIVRNALAFLAGGGAELVDGLLFPHTCDSIQGLATVLPDLGGWTKPVVHFIHPRGPRRESTVAYLNKEFRSFATDLEAFTGKSLDPARLGWALDLHKQIDLLTAKLLSRRAYLDLDDLTFYQALRKGEYLWPEDYLEELKGLEARLSDKVVQKGVPLMITGIVPEPMSLFENLSEAGAYIAADDYAAIGRRVLAYPDTLPNDPFEALVESYFTAPPCSTRALTINLRRDYLSGLLKSSGAKGVIIHNIKFCEPELYDIPLLKKRFAELNIPVLYMESELEPELSGQSVTRLEAFVEMASSDRSNS
jgi:benzoyl-CoA reductase/2-hydroxyglutaryl-CoA dehydratase subunit BcrC/BadD/HgdB